MVKTNCAHAVRAFDPRAQNILGVVMGGQGVGDGRCRAHGLTRGCDPALRRRSGHNAPGALPEEVHGGRMVGVEKANSWVTDVCALAWAWRLMRTMWLECTFASDLPWWSKEQN